ncbi:MAG TPA: hypothetical protein VK659_03275 [Asanoa sp.]|nr:hypothetical protein [Asanoa sp.]
MNVTTEQEAYLDAVKRALADLDQATRDELLEDLPEHLAEVAAEGEGPLAERLGPPEAYAAELRAAAGLAEAVAPARGLDDRVATAVRRVRGTLGAADRKAGPLFGYGRASEFLRMLLPAWWVLRGYLVAMAITVVTTGSEFGLLPRLGGSTLAAVLLLAVCVLASIWLGRREGSLPPIPKAGIVVAGVLLFIFGLVGFSDADEYGQGWIGGTESVSVNPYEYVQDIFVYDESGQLVRNVRLYDQDGQPIRLGDPYRCQQSYEYSSNVDNAGPAYPYCPDRPPYETAPVPGVVNRAPISYAPTPDESLPAPVDPSPTPEPTGTPAPTPAPTN